MNRHLAILRPVIIAIILIPVIVEGAPLQTVPVFEGGVLDLRNTDLRDPVYFNGEVPFYWRQLITDPENDPAVQGELLPFPSFWGELPGHDKRYTSKGYASYHFKIILPQRTAHYAAIIEDMYISYELYQDDELVANNGKVAATKEEYRPEWRPQMVEFYHTDSDTLDLVLQVANFHHSRGGLTESILFGERETIQRIHTVRLTYDLILTGCLIMGGLFFLGLYFFGRHESAILFFSLFCLTYSYRIIGSGYYVLHSLLENYPWWLANRIEYISLYISVLCFSRFVWHLYPEETSRTVFNIIRIGSWAVIVSTLALPLHYSSQILHPYFILLTGAFAYSIWVYIKAWLHQRPGSLYAMISTVVVMFVFTYEILVFFQWVEAMESLIFWGYILFFFSQSLLLSHRFAYSLKKAKERAEIASEAKTDFLATISHEIRTPLNAIVGMSHLVLRNNPRPDQVKSLESLTFSAENLTSLINDILDFNKIESGSLTLEYLPIDIESHATKIIKGYYGEADLKKIEVGLSVDPNLHKSLLADPVRLAQVLNNLINNALKFTERGRVDLEISVMHDYPDAQVLEVRVADTGIGIHKEKMEQIFERFTQASSSTTREFGGTGLGLSIVKGILGLYGSKINVSSQLGEGSVFSFVIKLDKSFESVVTEPERVELLPEHQGVLEGKRVLLVEDNIMNMVIAEQFLSRWGMQLGKATNGEDAIKLVQKEAYDLVLMDLHMPIMDGYAASRVIKKDFPGLPIVALTASTIAEQEQEIRQAGMDGYVLKPFHPKDLRAKLTQVLSV